MGALSKKLRSMEWGAGGSAIGHWCPGCDGLHVIVVKKADNGPAWEWDGNVNAPTCSPSVKVTGHDGVCHYYLKGGKIEFCGDSTHEFAGKTVELPDWPYAEGEYGGV